MLQSLSAVATECDHTGLHILYLLQFLVLRWINSSLFYSSSGASNQFWSNQPQSSSRVPVVCSPVFFLSVQFCKFGLVIAILEHLVIFVPGVLPMLVQMSCSGNGIIDILVHEVESIQDGWIIFHILFFEYIQIRPFTQSISIRLKRPRSMLNFHVALVDRYEPSSYHSEIHRERLQPEQNLIVHSQYKNPGCKVWMEFPHISHHRQHFQLRCTILHLR